MRIPSQLTDDEKQKLKRMHDAGFRWTTLANKFDCSVWSCRRVVHLLENKSKEINQ